MLTTAIYCVISVLFIDSMCVFLSNQEDRPLGLWSDRSRIAHVYRIAGSGKSTGVRPRRRFWGLYASAGGTLAAVVPTGVTGVLRPSAASFSTSIWMYGIWPGIYFELGWKNFASYKISHISVDAVPNPCYHAGRN